MTQVATIEASPPSSASKKDRRFFVARMATLYLAVPHSQADAPNMDLIRTLGDQLLEDPRVVSCEVPNDLDPDWCPVSWVYPPTGLGNDHEGVLNGKRHFHAQEYASPIRLKIHVLKKNQPTQWLGDDVPTEDYVAFWDGRTVLVLWEQINDGRYYTSGGHIVQEILTMAAAKAGAKSYVQACNPYCEFFFLHTDMTVTADPSAKDWSTTFLRRPTAVRVIAPIAPDIEEVADDLWSRYATSFEKFSKMKNLGRCVEDLETVLRERLDDLTALHHAHASVLHLPPVDRIKATWKIRSWRRRSRLLLSELWLGLGTLEKQRRSWETARSVFERRSDDVGIAELFDLDHSRESNAIQSLDISVIEASMKYAGSRLDNSAMVFATLMGASGGAVAGALIALLK